MKNIFTKTLTLIAFLSLSIGVWGETYTLDFRYTKAGCPDGQQSQYDACGTYSDKDKIIVDSDFGWSKGKDDVCNRNNGGEIDDWLMCKNSVKACSRTTYSFDATTVTVTLKVKCKDSGTYTGPTVKIHDTYSCSFGSITFSSGFEEKTLTKDITVSASGTYDISVEFAGSDKFYVQNIVFSFTSAPACENPTITTHPSSATYSQGATATALTVVASGTSLTYQWQESSNNSNWSNITNQTSTSYTPSTSATGTKYYRCVVTESGDCSTNSNAATITVNAATSFTAGQTLFIRSNGVGAWKDDACVKIDFSDKDWGNKSNTGLTWMYNEGNTTYKLFYCIVPSGITYTHAQLHRYKNDCSEDWGNAEWFGVEGSKNTMYSSTADKDNQGSWYSTNYQMNLWGGVNSWGSSLGTFTDQLNGNFSCTINNVKLNQTSCEFRVKDNYGSSSNEWFGTGNTTLNGLNTNSTYDITASFNIGTRGTLNLEKTFVKGKVTFNANGRGTAPSALDNVPAGAKIAEPEMAEVDHYYVEGWYKETGCTNKWNFATDEVTESMTLYAKWVAVPQYTITATSADPSKGSVTGGGTYDEGATVTLTATPETGYEFDKWSDNNTDNPRTITADNNKSYTAYFKKEAKVCNQLTIQCEDSYLPLGVVTGGTSSPSSDKFYCYTDGQSGGHSYSSSSHGSGYICIKDDSGKEIYFVFDAPEAGTYKFNVWAGEDQNMWLNVYTTNGDGDAVTYNAQTYKKKGNKQLSGSGSSSTFAAMGDLSVSLPKGRCIIGLYNGWGWPAYDQIVITASSDVFCPQTYTVYYEDANDNNTWKDAAIVDGAAQFTLAKDATFNFKIRKTSDGETYTYYGATADNNSYETSGTNWTLDGVDGSGYNVHLKTAARGTYTINVTTTGDYPQINITYPASYTATFDMQSHGTQVPEQTHLATGDKVVAPATTPADVEGWHFVGWYKEQACTNVFDFATETISSDVTIYAKWEKAVTGITITAAGGLYEIEQGMQLQLSVAYTPEDAVYGREITWTSDNTSYLTVDQNGLVTGVMAGSNHYITATTSNGKWSTYTIKVNPSTCTSDWKVHMWNTSGTNSSICLNQVGSSSEWRSDLISLPSNSDNEKIKVLYQGGDGYHGKEWITRNIPTRGNQMGECGSTDGWRYAGQDALGYFCIRDDSGDENNFLAFHPIYAITYGIEGQSGWQTLTEFENTEEALSSQEFYSSIVQVPADYASKNMYVGAKRSQSNPGVNFIQGNSSIVVMNTIPGLNSGSMAGKFGLFKINGNWCDNNLNCQFIRYYRLSYSGEGTEEYNPHYVLSTGSSSERTVTLGNVPVRTGYNISGWTIGSTLYTQGTSYTLADDATAVATWTPIEYHITYNNVEDATNTNPATYTIEDEIVLKDASRTGYDFAGWYLDGEFEHLITQISVGTHEDKTLYAKWTPTEYSITYNNLEGATNPNPTTYTIESETINFVDPGTRTGYTFGAWDPASIAHGSTGDKTITASWNLVNYSITYHDAGTHSNPTSYNIESSFALSAPTARTGFTFLGWYTDAQFTNPITAIAPGMHENKDIYAKWENAYCSNTRFIECEDEWLEDLKSKASGAVLNTGYYKNFSGRGFMDYKGPGGETFYFVHLGAATYEFEISRTNVPGGHLYLYSTNGTGESVTYKSVAYKRISGIDGDVSGGEGTEGTAFTKVTISDVVLSEEGDYLIGLAGGQWSSFDYIKITANSKVFCPEMYTVEFAANPSNKGTVTAQINGDAINSGDEVPENTVVVFTASDIASGYELVNWTDGSDNVLAGAVNSFEQTITSNITVNANIEVEATKYTVTATAGDEHGTITSGAGEYREDATVTIVTSPATNYKVGSATASNVNDFTIVGNNVSFTMPAAAVDVTINFVFDEVHNLIATGTSTNVGSQQGSGSSGSINVSSITDPTGHFTHDVLDYNYTMPNSGSYCGYSLPTDAGYKPNSKATGLAFWYIADDNVYMEIKVNGDNVFKLSSTNGEWHYIYLETSAVKTGTSFEIWMNYSKGGWSMTKSTGHVYFSEIQATNVTSQDPIVPPVNLTVAKNPNEGGTVTTSPEITTGLTKGTEVTLTATPADNYRFVNWTVGGEEVSKDATYARIVNATETITANFERVYTLTINNDGNGTATVSPNQTKFAEGESITVTSVPNSGYKFTAWLNGSNEQESTDDPYAFTMPASDKTLKVTFEESTQYFDISTAVEGEGTVTIKVDGETHSGKGILEGTQVTLTPTPNSESYAFTQWQDGNTDNPRTIIANAASAAITWTATFAQVYTVSVELGKPGKEVIGVGKYAGGAQVTLTAVANTKDSQDKPYDLEYQLKEWTAQGVDISGHEHDNPLTFEMPYNNVSLKATFAPVECVDTFVIQCEDPKNYISANSQEYTSGMFPHPIPNSEGCGRHSDHYYDAHGLYDIEEGTGVKKYCYFDTKGASNCESYYLAELPAAGTYKIEVWTAGDDDKHMSMNVYQPSSQNVVLRYTNIEYAKTYSTPITFRNDHFQINGTIEGIIASERQRIIIGIYTEYDYGAYDQIRITATEDVFCAPLSTTDFVIKADEIKEIPVCGVDNLTIYDGGQANNNDDVEVFDQVKYSRTVNDLDKWETFAVPYNANEITVQDIPHKDLKEYIINPIYGFEGHYNTGYFYMEELKGDDATLMGRPFATRWEISLTQYPQQNVPYIIRFPREQSNGYFENTQINYKYKSTGQGAGGESVILTGKKNATIIEEDYPGIEEKPTFYFYANNTLANIQLETSAYILNESGMNFDIQDQPVIPPFHCYVQATQKIKQMYPHLAMRNDGGGTTILMPLTEEDWKSMQAKKVLIDEVIYIVRDGKLYSIMGQLVK